MLERGYLWRVPWHAGPHMLFEQYDGLLVLSPAYKNKEKKKIKIDRCCAMRQNKISRSPRPSMFSRNYVEKYRSSVS